MRTSSAVGAWSSTMTPQPHKEASARPPLPITRLTVPYAPTGSTRRKLTSNLSPMGETLTQTLVPV